MPLQLRAFDFDSTLFNSPQNNPKTLEKYTQATGLPWLIDKSLSRQLTQEKGFFVPMRKGFWGRAETLQPPLVPIPAPAEWFFKEICDSLLRSKAAEDTITLILTGRHSGLRQQVLRILRDGKLLEIEDRQGHLVSADEKATLICLGDNAPLSSTTAQPKPTETFPWKVWILEQYLEFFPEILDGSVEIWEDRDEHVSAFRVWGRTMPVNMTIHHVVDGKVANSILVNG